MILLIITWTCRWCDGG